MVSGAAPSSDPVALTTVATRYWKAVYSGDASNNTVSSSCVAPAIRKWTPTVGLTVSPGTIVAGQTTAVATPRRERVAQAGGTVTYTLTPRIRALPFLPSREAQAKNGRQWDCARF